MFPAHLFFGRIELHAIVAAESFAVRVTMDSRVDQYNQALRGSCVLAAATAFALAGTMAHADISRENFTGYVTLTSDYRFRGLSQTDTDPALQVGIDFQHDSGIFAGLWGSNVDFPMDRFEEERRDVELNYYLGYHRSIGGDWAGVISVVRYAYPGVSENYDYTEISVGVDFIERLFATVAYTDDLYSHGGTAINYEIALQYPIIFGLELGATAGLYDISDLLDDSYKYWNIGLSKAVQRLSFDVRFHDTDSTAIRIFGDEIAGSTWTFSASWTFL